MSTHADISVEDGVAHIALNAGPSARLTTGVLQQIDTALETVRDNDAVEIVVLAAKHGFPSGLTDPRAGGNDTGTALADTCLALETFPNPVVAVLNGAIVGGGAELALACHYRLAEKDARIGFPNARLGLVPHAGATQRLPRLVGAEATFELLLGGHLMPLASDRLSPLVDHVFEGGPYEAVLQFVTQLRAEGAMPRPTSGVRSGFADPQAYQAAVNQARKRAAAYPENAPKHIISAVEAALVLPIVAGLAFEHAAYEDCSETAQSRALAHVFHAEQAAMANTRRRDLPQITHVAVLGGGPFASQIVVPALDAGLRVNWAIKDAVQQRDSVARVRAMLQHASLAGQMSPAKIQQCQDALRYGSGADMIDGPEIALRAARGQRGVSLPPDLPLAHCLPGTDPRLAMRFGPTTSQTRLVEVILGPKGTDTELCAALGLAKQMGLLTVVERTEDACLIDRLNHAMWRAADALVDLGQSPYAIDAAMRAWGLETPPFLAADHVSLANNARHDRHESSTNWAGVLIERGRDGTGSGKGFYVHDGKGTHAQDPQVLEILNAHRPPKPDLPATHIAQLLIGAMANAGAKALQEAVVDRASDIDLVSIFGGILPRWRGGILHSVREEGLLQITSAMGALDHPDKDFWTPDPIFADLIKYGHSFDDL